MVIVAGQLVGHSAKRDAIRVASTRGCRNSSGCATAEFNDGLIARNDLLLSRSGFRSPHGDTLRPADPLSITGVCSGNFNLRVGSCFS